MNANIENNITNDESIAYIFKVLSEPNRIKILRILTNSDHKLTCGEVSEKLNLSMSTVSYHFKTMRVAGLTKTERKGQQRLLSINYDTFNKLLPGFLESLNR